MIDSQFLLLMLQFSADRHSDNCKLSRTSFLLSPFYKGFFYAFFQAIFNTNCHLVRQLSRQRFLTAFMHIRFPVFLPKRFCKKNKTFARMHFYYIPEF